MIVRDGGVPGVVVRLLRGFAGITVEGHEVVAGGGALDLNVALTAREHRWPASNSCAAFPARSAARSR